MFGHISGAHVNPVISMAALILNEITVAQIPIYIFSQVSGCLAGYGFHKVTLKQDLILKLSNLKLLYYYTLKKYIKQTSFMI